MTHNTGYSRMQVDRLTLHTLTSSAKLIDMAPPVQVTKITMATHRPLTPWDEAVARETSEYVAWYSRFVQAYERDLLTAGNEDPEGLTYARDYGLPRLSTLSERLRVRNSGDAEVVHNVLLGFRLLAELVTDVDGRADLVITLILDPEQQLRDLGLLSAEEVDLAQVATGVAQTTRVPDYTAHQAAVAKVMVSQRSSSATQFAMAA